MAEAKQAKSRRASRARAEYAEQPHNGREANESRESDRLIVPEKAGNAAGGKETSKWSSRERKHRPRPEAVRG